MKKPTPSVTKILTILMLSVSLIQCNGAAKSGQPIHDQFDFQSIRLLEGVTQETFKTVITEWDEILVAILKYQPNGCLTRKLSRNSLSVIFNIDDERSRNFQPILKSQIINAELAIGLVTVDDCGRASDTGVSDPTWGVLKIGGEYVALDYYQIEE